MFAASRPVEVEPEEGEPSALVRVPTLESDQRALFVGELEGKFLQPLREGLQVGSDIFFMLEAHHAIIGIAHEMHFAATEPGDDALDPVVLHEVKVDVGQDGADDPTLWRSGSRVQDPAFFQHSGFEPLHDQGDEPPVRDAFFEHAHQPVVIHVIKEAPDIGFHDPAMVPGLEGFAQVQTTLARAPSRPVADALIMKVRFPDTFQDHLHGLLHDLVFKYGDSQRTELSPARFGNPLAFDAAGAVTPVHQALFQIHEIFGQVLRIQRVGHPVDPGTSLAFQVMECLGQKLVVQQAGQGPKAMFRFSFRLCSQCGQGA